MNQDKPVQRDEPTLPPDRNVPRVDAASPDPVNRPVDPDSVAPGEHANAPTVAELEQRLAAAEAKAAEHYEALLRAVAETENVRRRAKEDVARAQKFGIESFAESLLPVKDSLELALSAETTTLENMREGVGATLRLLAGAFEKHRLVELDPRGQKFDPNLHQAISTVPGAGTQPPIAPGHVAHVLQKGYTIADRVLRPALVTVVQG